LIIFLLELSPYFEVLLDPVEAGGLHSRGWFLKEDSKQTVLGLAHEVGSCSTCMEGKSLQGGFWVILNVTILYLGNARVPWTIEVVHQAVGSNNLGDEPHGVFDKEDILDVLANKHETGIELGITSSGSNPVAVIKNILSMADSC
jgi:hypothetical protein